MCEQKKCECELSKLRERILDLEIELESIKAILKLEEERIGIFHD